MIWPYPSKDTDPWFDVFESMIAAMDASGYASREDRSIILSEGGTVSFTASTGLLSWSSAIVMLSPIAAFKESIPAATVTILDGQILYINIVRSPLGNLTLSSFVANQLPNTDTAMALAIRSGANVYWRNGALIKDGQSTTLFSGGGGGANLLESVKMATRESHGSTTPLVVGGDSFNPLDYANVGFARSLIFRAVAANGDIGMTTSVTLYNLTDSDTVATLLFTSTTPTKQQITLTEGTGAGQIDPLEKVYEVRIGLTVPPGGPTNTIELHGAEILVVNTAI
jgi:hypothetical protein